MFMDTTLSRPRGRSAPSGDWTAGPSGVLTMLRVSTMLVRFPEASTEHTPRVTPPASDRVLAREKPIMPYLSGLSGLLSDKNA